MEATEVEAAIRTYNKEVNGSPNPIFITGWTVTDDYVEVVLFSPQALVGWPNGSVMRVSVTNIVDFRSYLSMMRSAVGPSSREAILASEVKWVVNDNAELGVRIGDQCFFFYQGRSLCYPTGKHDTGLPRKWRYVASKEFGDTVAPSLHDDVGGVVGVAPFYEGHEWYDMTPDPANQEVVE